jgi:hypothetical protein
MAKIELEIIANNSQYISSAKEVEQATQSMQTKNEQSQKKQSELINQTVNAYKNVSKEKSKAFDTKPIEEHTKKTEAAAGALEGVGGAAGGAVGKVKSLSAAFKALLANPIALAIMAIIGAFTALIKLMKTTDSGANLIAARFAQIRAILDVVRQRVLSFGSALGDLFKGNFKEAAQGMKEAFTGIGDQMKKATDAAYDYVYAIDAIEDAENNYVSTAAENRNKIARLEYSAQDRKNSITQRKEYLKEALALGLEEVTAQREFLRQRLDATITNLAALNRVTEQELLSFIKMTDAERENADQALKDLYNRNEDKVNDLDKMYGAWIDLDTRYYEENKRNISRLSGFDEEANREATEKKKQADELRLKNQEDFIKASLQLQDEYEKTQIKQLSGEEKVIAERDYQLKQIQLLEDHLKTLGTLTEDHYKYIDGLRADAELTAKRAIAEEQQNTLDFWSEFYDEATNERLKFYDFREQLDLKTAEVAGNLTGQKELEIQKKWLQARIDLLKASQNPQLLMQAELLDAELALIDKKLKGAEGIATIWDAIGLGDNPEAQKAIQEGIDQLKDALDEIYDARVEDAKRTVDLLDEQISQTTDALAAETELMKAGYANNVDAKRKELEDLKAQREKAIKEEQKAVKAQRALDTITQISSLVTASANIIKGFSKIPIVGVALGIAAVALMLGTFAAAKGKAAKAAKLAKGGSGVVTGNLHSEGGERFGDHLEVERGEAGGVLSRPATKKYGKIFSEMVNSFNKGKLPTISNNIVVDNDKTVNKLMNVEGQLITLNKHFKVQKEVHQLPGMRIERSGHKTRIIRHV